MNIFYIILIWFFFGLQHSFLARPNTKKKINKIFGKVFEKCFYPFIYFISQCIIFVICYDLIRQIDYGVIYFSIDEDLIWIFYLANKISNLFLILTVFHFNIGKFTGIENLLNYFFKKENINNMDENLNQNYLYKYIRHPMYFGIILVYITSTTFYTTTFFINIICIVVYIEIGSYYEEKSLIFNFKQEYIDYKAKTFKYIPFIR